MVTAVGWMDPFSSLSFLGPNLFYWLVITVTNPRLTSILYFIIQEMTTASKSRRHLFVFVITVIIICLCKSRVHAFCGGPRSSLLSVTARHNGWRPTTRLTAVGSDEEKEVASSQQTEKDGMMQDTRMATGQSLFQDDSGTKEGMNLYNAVPLFTGVIVLFFSLFITGYMFYAGLTGDDPLMGHPK